jgi:imidazolonepropionase-like amidohydrolase
MGPMQRTLLPLLLLAASSCTPRPADRDSGSSAGAEPGAVTSGAPAVTAKTTVLLGARLVDGSGGPPIDEATLVIEGELLRAVGPASSVHVPKGAAVVDLGGKTVIAGLVADHAHVGMVDGVSAGARNCTRANVLRQLAQFEAYGVTTVTSLGLNGPLFYELQPALHRGTLPGADLFGADRGIGVPSAAPPVDAGPENLYRAATPEEARAAVREMAGRRPSLVKIWVDDFHGTLPEKMRPDIYNAVIDEAHHRGLRVAAHVYYLADAKQLVASGVDVLAHGVRDRPVDDEFIQAMKAHHTFYIPTLGLDESFYVYAEQPSWMDTPFFKHAVQPALAVQLADPAWRARTLSDAKGVATDKQAVATNLANFKAVFDAGVAVGFGTDSGATPLRIPGFAEHHELALMVKAGLTPLQAIRVATHDAAALLQLDDRGTLAPGKLADLVVVDGNPATDIGAVDHIVAVWHRGKQVRAGVETFTP